MREIPAIAVHHTAVTDGTWDGPAAEAAVSTPITQGVASDLWAWQKGEWPTEKSGYKFPHHFVSDGKPGTASIAGVNNAMARVKGADIPDADRAGVEAHLKAHQDDYKGDDKKKDVKKSDDLDDLVEIARELGLQVGVTPGTPRHGDVGIRAILDAPWEFRDDLGTDDGSLGLLTGHFAVFNRWTEIDSFWEGRFLEMLAPGAFTKTFAENRRGMRCLFQHGRDPQVGMKPLGPIQEVREDGDVGAYYEVPLFDTSYNRDLLPPIKGGQMGASFRFQVMREEVTTKPDRSEHNPDGIEERKITEVKVREFGPVTFGAYEDATAGVRSLNDLFEEDGERMRQLLTHLRSRRRGVTAPREVEDPHPQTGAEDEVRTDPQQEEQQEEHREEETPAPSQSRNPLRRPVLPSAARPLRTSHEPLEVPRWRL